MRLRFSLTCAALLLTCGVAAHLGAQAAPPQGFPAQQRQLADEATIARGRMIYEINCRACHGPDLRGGDAGGPNLLRSQLALTDQHGELIMPVVKQGRQTPGLPPMPPLALPDGDIIAVAEYIHSVQATARGQGAPPAGPTIQLNIVVGNPQEGRAYFDAKCARCHSGASMQGIATRIPDPMQLQNTWVSGTPPAQGGRGATPVSAIVTTRSGEHVEGALVRADDFTVVVQMPDGTQRSFARASETDPRVQIKDPRDAHRALWRALTDKDMHDVTAYLVTLK